MTCLSAAHPAAHQHHRDAASAARDGNRPSHGHAPAAAPPL